MQRPFPARAAIRPNQTTTVSPALGRPPPREALKGTHRLDAPGAVRPLSVPVSMTKDPGARRRRSAQSDFACRSRHRRCVPRSHCFPFLQPRLFGPRHSIAHPALKHRHLARAQLLFRRHLQLFRSMHHRLQNQAPRDIARHRARSRLRHDHASDGHPPPHGGRHHRAAATPDDVWRAITEASEIEKWSCSTPRSSRGWAAWPGTAGPTSSTGTTGSMPGNRGAGSAW